MSPGSGFDKGLKREISLCSSEIMQFFRFSIFPVTLLSFWKTSPLHSATNECMSAIGVDQWDYDTEDLEARIHNSLNMLCTMIYSNLL